MLVRALRSRAIRCQSSYLLVCHPLQGLLFLFVLWEAIFHMFINVLMARHEAVAKKVRSGMLAVLLLSTRQLCGNSAYVSWRDALGFARSGATP